jgi:hypothetical protein
MYIYTMPKRCPNGTRRNKTSGKCEPTNSVRPKSPKKNNKTAKKSPVEKCNKMPDHRIKGIIRFEKLSDSTFDAGKKRNPGYYEGLEKNLKEFCFPKNFGYKQWNEISSYDIALRRAI